MKLLKSLTLALIFNAILSSNILNAQQIELINSGELLEEGIKLHDEGNYEDAIELYNKISRNDTNYVIALIELSLSYNANKEYEKAIETSLKGLSLNTEFNNSFYINIGNAYDDLEQFDKAVDYYDLGLKEFPRSYMLYFNKGVALYRAEKYKEAVEAFQKSIEINYYYPSNHLYLGKICAEHGKFVPAIMAIETFLVLEPVSDRSYNSVTDLANISNNSFEVKFENEDHGIDFGDKQFSDIDLIIKSKVALDKKYKTIVKLNDPIVKQSQLVFESIEYDKNNLGFWNQKYVGTLEEILKQGYIEPFTYLIFSSVNNSKIQSWLDRNKTKLKSFISYYDEEISQIMKEKSSVIEGELLEKPHWYYSSHDLQAIGEIETDSKGNSYQTGDWVYFRRSGVISAEGSFNEDGMKEGIWKYYYPNKNLMELKEYNDGKLDGYSNAYYENGQLKYKFAFSDNIMEGISCLYYNTGQLKRLINLKNNEFHGEANEYFPNGNISMKRNFKNNKMDSVFTEYHPNGNISMTGFYKNGLYQGEFKAYNEDNVLTSEGNWDEGKRIGEWKWYNDNGSLMVVRNYDEDGKENGFVEFYNDKNTLVKNYTIKNDKLEGYYKEFDDDGILHFAYEYSNDKIIKITFYDKKGNVIHSAEKKYGKLDYVFYDPYGNKRTEGVYDIDGYKIGEWKYYYNNGKLKSIEHFNKGIEEGKYIVYFKNGNISYEYNYENDKKDGYYISKYRNGVLEEEGWYVKGDLTGTWQTYNELGQIQSKTYYLNNERTGYQEYYHIDGKINYEKYIKEGLLEFILYYDTLGNIIDSLIFDDGQGIYNDYFFNGAKKFESHMKNNKFEGQSYWYFPSGKINSEVNFENDLKHGKYISYYESGKKRIEGQHIRGDRTGVWTWYYENGKKETVFNYKQNDLNGEAIWYYENGQLELKKETKDDLNHGDYIVYDEKGNVLIKKYYVEGKLVSYTYVGKNGEFIESIPVENETGEIISYFKNGNKSYEQTYKDGYLEGKSTIYYDNGKIHKVKTYKSSKVDGLSYEYYENGQLKSEENFYFGNKHGKCTYYYSNGNIEKIEYYYLDEKHGVFSYFDKNGKKLKQENYVYDYKF